MQRLAPKLTTPPSSGNDAFLIGRSPMRGLGKSALSAASSAAHHASSSASSSPTAAAREAAAANAADLPLRSRPLSLSPASIHSSSAAAAAAATPFDSLSWGPTNTHICVTHDVTPPPATSGSSCSGSSLSFHNGHGAAAGAAAGRRSGGSSASSAAVSFSSSQVAASTAAAAAALAEAAELRALLETERRGAAAVARRLAVFETQAAATKASAGRLLSLRTSHAPGAHIGSAVLASSPAFSSTQRRQQPMKISAAAKAEEDGGEGDSEEEAGLILEGAAAEAANASATVRIASTPWLSLSVDRDGEPFSFVLPQSATAALFSSRVGGGRVLPRRCLVSVRLLSGSMGATIGFVRTDTRNGQRLMAHHGHRVFPDEEGSRPTCSTCSRNRCDMYRHHHGIASLTVCSQSPFDFGECESYLLMSEAAIGAILHRRLVASADEASSPPSPPHPQKQHKLSSNWGRKSDSLLTAAASTVQTPTSVPLPSAGGSYTRRLSFLLDLDGASPPSSNGSDYSRPMSVRGGVGGGRMSLFWSEDGSEAGMELRGTIAVPPSVEGAEYVFGGVLALPAARPRLHIDACLFDDEIPAIYLPRDE